MKHLVIVSDAWEPQINGVVTTMKIMVEEAYSHNWKVTVIHPGLFKNISLPGYSEIKLAVNVWKLNRLIPDDVNSIHIVTEGPLGWTARLLCGFRGWKYTSGFHTNFPEYLERVNHIPAWLTYPIFRWFHKNSQAVLVPSKSTSDKLSKKGFKNLVVWSRGFREDIFSPNRRREDLLDRDKINLLYVGRVSAEKNIEAFLALSKNSRYCLWVIGDGPDRARLERIGGATFVGFKKGIELAEYYASADVFVFPSLTDTLGIVNIEAMACGTPVAAYDVEGPRDVVINGQGGFLGDLEDSVEKALRLRGDISVLRNAWVNTWKNASDTFYNCLVMVK